MFWLDRLVASPLPVLWATLGYGLQEAWPYPLAVAIWRWRYRHGAHAVGSNDLRHLCAPQRFCSIAHFGWPRNRVAKAMHYYLMSIGLIVPLIMAVIMFGNLNDRQFSASLGRLCFILICGALAVVTLSLKTRLEYR